MRRRVSRTRERKKGITRRDKEEDKTETSMHIHTQTGDDMASPRMRVYSRVTIRV